MKQTGTMSAVALGLLAGLWGCKDSERTRSGDTTTGTSAPSAAPAATSAGRAAADEKTTVPEATKGPSSWQGKWGTMKIESDGSVEIALRNCFGSSREPGHYELDHECDPTNYAGRLVAKDYSIGVEKKAGDGTSTDNFAAYVDTQGRLHLTVGGLAAPLGPDRRGTIEHDMFTNLVVGDSCQLVKKAIMPNDKPDQTTVKCAFIKKGGHSVFVYEAPAPGEPGKMEQQWLYFLPELGLLVSPELYHMSFERQ